MQLLSKYKYLLIKLMVIRIPCKALGKKVYTTCRQNNRDLLFRHVCGKSFKIIEIVSRRPNLYKILYIISPG